MSSSPTDNYAKIYALTQLNSTYLPAETMSDEKPLINKTIYLRLHKYFSPVMPTGHTNMTRRHEGRAEYACHDISFRCERFCMVKLASAFVSKTKNITLHSNSTPLGFFSIHLQHNEYPCHLVDHKHSSLSTFPVYNCIVV